MASPPPVWQSEAVSESARREAALRATLGFRTDPMYVQQLIHERERFDAMPDEESFGYHFTPAERQEFLDRMALQRSGIDIATWALEHATHDYAGSRLDHAAGGVLVVGFRSEPRGRRAAVMERASDPGRVRILQVPFSREQYEAMSDAIFVAGHRLAADGVPLASVGHDWEGGRLRIGVVERDVDGGAALPQGERARRYADTIRAILPKEFQAVEITFVEPEVVSLSIGEPTILLFAVECISVWTAPTTATATAPPAS